METKAGSIRDDSPTAGSGTVRRHTTTQPIRPGQPAATLAQRIYELGLTLIAGLPRSKRHHDAARLDDEDHARLDRVLTATVHALPLGGPAIARSVFGVHPDAPGITDLVRTARLVRDAGRHADLRAATDALGRAAQDIGLDRFKPFLRNADAHLAGQGGLLTLIREMPRGPDLTPSERPPQMPGLPTPARLPWSMLIVGAALQALPALTALIEREDVRDTIRRFHLDPSRPADVVAAYAFLWAENHGPWLFDTPQTGPAMLTMAERVMRVAQADPDLFQHALANDLEAQAAVSAAVRAPVPGSGLETRNDEERALLDQMRAAGRSAIEIQAALDTLRARGTGNTATERRNSRGQVIVGEPLPRIDDPWLTPYLLGDRGAPIPGQVAEKLRGLWFRDFGALRDFFWRTVARTPELARQFDEANLERMQLGRPPAIPRLLRNDLGDAWQLHHYPAIKDGGPVYDLSKIFVMTSKQHREHHRGKE